MCIPDSLKRSQPRQQLLPRLTRRLTIMYPRLVCYSSTWHLHSSSFLYVYDRAWGAGANHWESVCLCVCVCVCIYVCMCVFEYMYVCVYVPSRGFVFVCVRVYVQCACQIERKKERECLCVCMCVCVCVWVSVCLYGWMGKWVCFRVITNDMSQNDEVEIGEIFCLSINSFIFHSFN